MPIPRLRLSARGSDTSRSSEIRGDLLFLMTRGIMGTVTLRWFGGDEILACKRQGRPLVFVCWHGHDLINLGGYHHMFGPDSRGVIMVPETASGMALRQFGRRLNIDVVVLPGADAGSMQWARGIARMTALIKQGHHGMIAVDGPSGPARQVKPGAAVIARRAGAIIVPSAVGAWPALNLRRRWDNHLIPFPFGRVVACFGPIIYAAPPTGEKLTVVQIQQRVAQALGEGTLRAEQLARGLGRPPHG